jgi:hypothetical protein
MGNLAYPASRPGIGEPAFAAGSRCVREVGAGYGPTIRPSTWGATGEWAAM